MKHFEVRVNCDLTKYLQRKLYFFGSYEEEHTKYWAKLASDSSTIFDVGANIGLYTLIAAVENPQATVHAFEPTPEMVETLLQNVQLNELRNVRVNKVAIGKKRTLAYLQYCTGSGGDNEGMNFLTLDPENQTNIQVEVTSIDDYCRQQDIDYIDLMKMDIEGGEYNALLGASDCLRTKAIGCVFMELSASTSRRSGHSTEDVVRILTDADYRIYRLIKGHLMRVSSVHDCTGDIIAFAQEPHALAHGRKQI